MTTALHEYLKANSIGDADFAVRIRRDRSMVSKMRRGIVQPSLELAATIERETDGNVPIRSWLDADGSAEAPRVEAEGRAA